MVVKTLLNIPTFLILCPIFCGATASQCSQAESSIYGMMLRRHVIAKITGISLGGLCLLECYRDVRCQSYNYLISRETCELNNRTKEARPEDFVPDSGRYYFRRVMNRVPLGSIPELPAETCKEIKASEGVQTVSGEYWFDSIIPERIVLAHCDMNTEDVDECSVSAPLCHVNADCKNTLGSYRCTCKAGFTGEGKTCIDVDECSASVSVCDVNADCKNTLGSYRCSCKAGFGGDGKTCAAPVVTATSSCANLLVHQTQTSGIIQTGNYSRHSDNMDCSWNISANTMLQLEFLRFHIRDSNDYLLVYDGGSSSSPLIAKFNNVSTFPLTPLPAPVTSSANKLYVRFVSDASNVAEGILARYQAITSGSIRLNGNTSTTGRVEIFYDGQWGTVCDDAWDINDANVVCKQLGYQQASRAFRGATYGPGSGPIWMNDVSCSGGESHLYDCARQGWGNSNCTHSQDASVDCSAVRLVNGGANYGRVEISLNGIWGTVCDDNWGISDANVVCRQLGFSSASSAPHDAPYGQGSGYIWMDLVNCQGAEASLFDCSHHQTWANYWCRHNEDAGVVCVT